MKKDWTIAILIAAGLAVLSSALFFAQGGFGGGHGDYDRAIFCLGLPWSAISWPEYMLKHDSVWLIMLPFVLNICLIRFITLSVRRLRSKAM